MPSARQHLPCGIALCLGLITLWLFLPAARFEFVNYDDNLQLHLKNYQQGKGWRQQP